MGLSKSKLKSLFYDETQVYISSEEEANGYTVITSTGFAGIEIMYYMKPSGVLSLQPGTYAEGVANFVAAYRDYALDAEEVLGSPVTDVFTPQLEAKMLALSPTSTPALSGQAIAEGVVLSWTNVNFTYPLGSSIITQPPQQGPLQSDLIEWLSSPHTPNESATILAEALHKGTITALVTTTTSPPPPPPITGPIS